MISSFLELTFILSSKPYLDYKNVFMSSFWYPIFTKGKEKSYVQLTGQNMLTKTF